jgi:protein-L-isoaspartate(D-aspartate) O-methyltransferase
MRIISYELLGAKKQLIEKLKANGYTDKGVLEAFDKVNRHLFLDSIRWHEAYEDAATPIRCNQTISRPSTVALQTQLLEVKKGDKILEIGTGSGFQAAILSAMGAIVFTMERHQELYLHTKQLLDKIDSKIATYFGDGYKGLPQRAPFDKIIVTCGAPEVPTELYKQLKIGGILVIPVGYPAQKMVKITKKENGEDIIKEIGDCAFVPMLEKENRL